MPAWISKSVKGEKSPQLKQQRREQKVYNKLTPNNSSNRLKVKWKIRLCYKIVKLQSLLGALEMGQNQSKQRQHCGVFW